MSTLWYISIMSWRGERFQGFPEGHPPPPQANSIELDRFFSQHHSNNGDNRQINIDFFLADTKDLRHCPPNRTHTGIQGTVTKEVMMSIPFCA